MANERPKNNYIAVSLDQKTVLRSPSKKENYTKVKWRLFIELCSFFFFFTKYELLVITSIFISGICSIA